jgi:hypothetical protein
MGCLTSRISGGVNVEFEAEVKWSISNLLKVKEIFQGSSRPRSNFADLTTELDVQSKAGTITQWSWGK